MSKHKHYEMICAKAGNMDLVVLFKDERKEPKWRYIATTSCFPTNSSDGVEYFLCLPQHKEACLHWLNGGDVQNNITKHKRGDSWVDFMPFNFPTCERWSQDCNFMRESSNFRIKPRKEKRWIGVIKSGETTMHYPSKDELIFILEPTGTIDLYQFIEIEVDV